MEHPQEAPVVAKKSAMTSMDFKLYDIINPYNLPIPVTCSYTKSVSELHEMVRSLGVIPYHPFELINITDEGEKETVLITVPLNYPDAQKILRLRVIDWDTRTKHVVLVRLSDEEVIPHIPLGMEDKPWARLYACGKYSAVLIRKHLAHFGITHNFRLIQHNALKYSMVKLD